MKSVMKAELFLRSLGLVLAFVAGVYVAMTYSDKIADLILTVLK